MAFYLNPVRAGLDAVSSLGDGSVINLKWYKAYPSIKTNGIAYHIYYSNVKEDVYSDGVKYVSIDGSLEANIIGLTPGQLYFFSIRPVEYTPSYLENDFNIILINNFNVVLIIDDLETQLPLVYDSLRAYPTSILRSNISESDLIIPLLNTDEFPDVGIIKIGIELIQYSSVDKVNNNLILTSLDQRGYNNTPNYLHTINGYDGYNSWNPSISLFIAGENTSFDRIFMCQSRFEYPNFPFTLVDGYRQVLKDILNTDLSSSDAENINFPVYDYAGYHRTDPVQLLNGTCVGSYIGGEMGCIDGYGNINFIRGLSLQDQNNQRQEILLNVTGRPAVLIKRVHTGIQCSCYLASSEYQDDRCPLCYGTKFVFGYEQFFNPRRSDGRILVRTSPADDGVKMQEAGLESELNLDLWTLTVPTIHQRDVIILFDVDDNEEFRYEVGTVTRNNTIVGMEGGQKFKGMRIRKTDPAYQIRVFRNTAMFPSKLNTTIGFTIGIPPHSHEIVVNEGILTTNQINQTTSVVQGHNHPVIDGTIMEVLGHRHNIILP
jgi:hypothetical protein